MKTVGGATVRTFCGPAKAVVKVGGKTLHFKGGKCETLSGYYPRVPHRIDGELLRYAARFGLLAHKDDQIDEHDRYAIRAGFWREIDVRTATEHAPRLISSTVVAYPSTRMRWS